jgi:sugar lactone lactonase YvrE
MRGRTPRDQMAGSPRPRRPLLPLRPPRPLLPLLPLLLLLPLLPLLPLLLVSACGPTEVLVGDAPGVARVVAGVLGVPHVLTFPDTAGPGDALDIPLGMPAGLAAFDDGSFYFADQFRRRVGYVTPDGRLAWPVGAGACANPGPGSGVPTTVCLAGPGGIALASDGALLIADEEGHRVYRYDPAAGQVSVVLGTGQPGRASDGAVAGAAPTDRPADVAAGPGDLVYVAERGNGRVVRVEADGSLSVVAGSDVQGDAGDGGPARGAAFRQPAGLAWIGDTLYIADRGTNRIRRVIHDSVFAYAGLGAADFAGDRGPAQIALFNAPGHLAAVGTLLLVADRGNRRVRIIRVGPDSIDTFGGTGAAMPGPDLQPIGATGIAGPAGVAAVGRLIFVSDSGGSVVRRVVR